MVIPSVANCARFYALLKIHKLALFLSESQAHLICNNLYTVKNSFDFVGKVKLISSSNYTMISLDVKSLFTNVPIQEALLGKKVT